MVLTDLKILIREKDFTKFKTLLDNNIEDLKKFKIRNLNEIILECLNGEQGCDFIEYFIYQLTENNSHFVCWDESCKYVVKMYIDKSRQFTPYSIFFLLRCYDLELIEKVFQSDLIGSNCTGECENWHLMFVVSYHERFFSRCFETIFEGFLARFILICKLMCSLKQKRSFLTWFAGSLHLYTEYLMQSEEARFKFVLIKLFESLILNGLLNFKEFKNLINMLIKRNEEMVLNLNSKSIEFFDPNSSQSSNQQQKQLDKSSNFLNCLDSLFPLSLKNACRLVIKRNMNNYSKSSINKLPLPANLKRFIYFEADCESVYKSFNSMKKKGSLV